MRTSTCVTCPGCGGARKFELQLMPALLFALKVDDHAALVKPRRLSSAGAGESQDGKRSDLDEREELAPTVPIGAAATHATMPIPPPPPSPLQPTRIPGHGNAVQQIGASQAASERSDAGGEGEEPSQVALLDDLRRAAMERRAAAVAGTTAAGAGEGMSAAAAKETAVLAYDPSEGGGASPNLLLKKPESGGMDWGVVAIYSCEASCAESEEEFVVVQAPID